MRARESRDQPPGKRVASLPLLLSIGAVLFGAVTVAAALLAYFSLRQPESPHESFIAILQRLDGGSGENTAQDLLRAESLVVGTESSLSVCRRAREAYTSGAVSAAFCADLAGRLSDRFPHNSALAAVAADASLNADRGEKAISYAGRISDQSLRPVALKVFVRTGALDHPDSAGRTSFNWRSTLSSTTEAPSDTLSSSLFIDTLLSLLQAGDRDSVILALKSAPPADGSPQYLSNLGDIAYSLGLYDMAYGAFRLLGPDDGNPLRVADAAALGGMQDEASSIWKALYGPLIPKVGHGLGVNTVTHPPGPWYSYARSLGSELDRAAVCEALLSVYPEYESAAVLLARSAGTDVHARSIAEASLAGSVSKGGLGALEVLRRQTDALDPWALAPKLWLALNAHPKSEFFAHWCAWRFSLAGDYDDALRVAQGFKDSVGDRPWMRYYEGLSGAIAGKVDEAAAAFRAAPAEDGDWRIAANLGLLEVSRLDRAKALKLFETAVALAKDHEVKARLLVDVAAQLKALGKESDSSRTLEYALSLDPHCREASTTLRGAGAGK